MLPTELSKYKPLYLQTALDYIRTLESNLYTLSNDPGNAEAIGAVHICAHSLKGQSLMMQYTRLGDTCYALERLFREVHNGKKTLTAADIQKLLGIVAAMKESLSDIAAYDIEKNLDSSHATVEAMIAAT